MEPDGIAAIPAPADQERSRRPRGTWYRAAEVVAHPWVLSAADWHAELIRRSRAWSTVAEFAALQRELVAEALDIQKLSRGLKQDKLAAAAEIRAAGLQPRERRFLSDEIAGTDLALDALQRRAASLRGIQDGLAWKLLNYDRSAIHWLGAGTPTITPSQSFASELARAEQHWAEGRYALITDLAGGVNAGDLLIRERGRAEVWLEEVKTNPRAESPRQRRFLLDRLNLLNHGASADLAPQPIRLLPTRPRLRTHLATLGDLLRRAGRDGAAIGVVAPHLAVAVLDARTAGRFEGDEVAYMARITADASRRFRRAAWRPAKSYAAESIGRLRRDERTPAPLLAPYGIYPFDPPTCAALGHGLISYRATLDLAKLRAALERSGWSIEYHLRDDSFLTARRANTALHIPSSYAEMLLMEAVTLPSWAAMLDVAANVEADSDIRLGWAWNDEAMVWL